MNDSEISDAITIAQAKDIALQQGLAGTDREVMNILEQRGFRLALKLDAALKVAAAAREVAHEYEDKFNAAERTLEEIRGYAEYRKDYSGMMRDILEIIG